MQDLKITLVQTDIFWENPEANRNSIEEKLANFSDVGDLLILPEMFTTGFTLNASEVAEPINYHTIKWLAQIASQYNTTVVGSLVTKDRDKFYNRLCVVNEKGLAGYYDKRHLFRMSEENEVYTAGKERLGFTIKGWNILPLVCYDLRFPVWSRNIDNTFDLILYCANWPAQRSEIWTTLLKSRAIENLCYTAGVNRVGSDANNIDYNGQSAVYFPDATCEINLENSEVVKTVYLSAEKLEDFRKDFPAHLDADKFELHV